MTLEAYVVDLHEAGLTRRKLEVDPAIPSLAVLGDRGLPDSKVPRAATSWHLLRPLGLHPP